MKVRYMHSGTVREEFYSTKTVEWEISQWREYYGISNRKEAMRLFNDFNTYLEIDGEWVF